jgi:hypothetical protein
MHRIRGTFFALLATLTLASVAGAQSIAGTVRDSSGAVLPGVTVEASSAALIEKARSVVTDANGQFQIIDLRPGTYDVTFTLPGFSTVARKGLELSGGGVTTVNTDMRVGGVQETITVTGESPVVDVQTSTSREQVLSNEFIRALPAARGYGNYLAGVPGISGTGLSSGAATSNNFFTSRGGRSSEGNIQLDGMNVGSSVGGGGVSGYQYDMSNASEVQVTIAGGLAEVDRGGPAFNMIPKTGGNTFSGFYFGSLAGEWAQGSNLDDELRSYGFADLPALIKSWDTNFAFSGPILRNRIWFYSNARTIGTYQDVAGRYGNLNASNANLWSYAKDDSVKVRNANSKRIGATRLTWQASPRDKFGFYIDYTKNCSGSSYTKDSGQCRSPGDGWTASGPGIGPGVPTTSPESGTIWDARAKIMQASYSAPWSSRVLVEAGFSSFWTEWGDIRPVGSLVDRIPVTEQTSSDLTGTPTSNFIYHGWPTTAGTISKTRSIAVRSPMSPARTAQDRLPGRLHGGQNAHVRWRPARLPFQQRRPEPDHAAARTDADEQPHGARRVFRPGHLDSNAPHDPGRAALRARAQLLPRRAGRHRGAPLRPGILLPEDRRGARHQRHHAAHGRVVRPVRQRQDRCQGEPEQVPPGRLQRRRLYDQQPRSDAAGDDDARVDRHDVSRGRPAAQQLRRRLRLHEPCRQRRMRRVGQSELGPARAVDGRQP